MKRLFLIVAALSAVITSWGQNTKKMNSIKRSTQYLYAEATMENAAEAFDVANDLLLIQVKEYAESHKTFRDKTSSYVTSKNRGTHYRFDVVIW